MVGEVTLVAVKSLLYPLSSLLSLYGYSVNPPKKTKKLISDIQDLNNLAIRHNESLHFKDLNDMKFESQCTFLVSRPTRFFRSG